VITALHDAQGTHRGFAKVTRDLTQHRRIDTLEHESRHLTRFIAVLGHELRNPLTAIANATTLLPMVESAPQRVQDVHGVLSRQVAHLRRLVDDLLDVGRIVSGKVHMERIPIRLQEVVAGAVEAMAPEFRKRGQRLDVEDDQAPLWILGDKARLAQVLGNLLHNACKFTPEGGQVRVVLARDDTHAELRVSDNGCGIAPTELKRVFGLFEQGEDAATPGHGGLGIGLNLVHQIVLQHDGEVSAFSTGEPGKGAEFVVRLPLVDAPADDGTP
jgi:signal transduction histidine kinase